MKKFVLVPEAKHRQAMTESASVASVNRDVLQSIQQPEQRELLRRYHQAQNVLEDARRSPHDDGKMAEYRQAMQDFSLLRDRRGVVKLPEQPVAKKRRVVSDDDDDRVLESDAAVVDVLPASQKGNAQKLLRLLRSDDTVSWTRNGEVSIHGQRLRGTNIVDLIGDVVRSSPSKFIAPQREQFLNALADANVPETLVKNKTALERYRAIKNDDAVAMTATETERYDDDDDNEAIDDATVSSTTSVPLDNKKKKKRAVKQVTTTAINWNAPH